MSLLINRPSGHDTAGIRYQKTGKGGYGCQPAGGNPCEEQDTGARGISLKGT